MEILCNDDYLTARRYFVLFTSPNLLGCDRNDLDKIHITVPESAGKNAKCPLLFTPMQLFKASIA